MTGGRRSVEEHVEHVAALLAPLRTRPTVKVPLARALNRVLAEPILAPIDLPAFRNSQMDGYAVDAAAVATVPVTLPVRGVLAAGAGMSVHEAGTARKIMTGAPIPEGADAVVPVEDTTDNSSTDGQPATVTVHRSVTAGTYVRERGSDIAAGAELLPAGQVLAPRHIAALAAVGMTEVPVRALPRVAVISTGSELVFGGTDLGPGKIFNSNGPALAASALANGAEVVSVDHSDDDAEEFALKLTHAADVAEVVITSGGVSKGDFEVVKDVLGPRGGEFVSVAMQPGGPQGTAVVDGIPVLAFPGNPVSALISFEVFTRPLLRAAAGLPAIEPLTLPLTADLTSVAGKRQFFRARRDGDGVTVVSGPGSHLIAGMSGADALLDVAADTTSLRAGDLVKVLPL
ncbi:molybdopterin molybdotransferase MoeA [Rhodococcus sp. NPDC003382]|uniref:molybdopterin molybdotransferase MoeA n=1 Tax=Rhodococcus sp. HM1 TaxID=2937759 RepID=UPI00200B176C|nr:gephyrin-like molybdotransferase Glp [Rhodococcus sp. HM1]MCK8670297.1 molybdopterin molybdotransferase MoeA [Rhodococcus sp. HM1]